VKKNVMIRIDAEIVKKAKDLGLNISKISENALKEYIKRLEGSNHPKNSNPSFSVNAFSEKGLVGTRRFELPTFGYHRSRTSSFHQCGP